MQTNTEYQIYIGCRDPQSSDELISADELRKMLAWFFSQNKISFSVYSAKGGYLHKDGRFISENSLCINLIGDYDLDIIRLTKNLSMFMNQECSLVIKDIVSSEYR